MTKHSAKKTTPAAQSGGFSGDLIGREREFGEIEACLKAYRNVLLEGPVGVGKTRLALAVTRKLGRGVFRIDGDSRYTEQKLTGWFDPPTVIKQGFGPKSFFAGPLTEAMTSGGVLFINELNRLPEGVQNVLLPAIDERMLSVPRLGEIRAKAGFLVIATQNPKEFVATSHLSEAILDRFELVTLDYQAENEEISIVNQALSSASDQAALLAKASVRLVRMTRSHPRIRRGASIRAAMSTAEIALALMTQGMDLGKAFVTAVILALPTRIEIERDAESSQNPREDSEALLREFAARCSMASRAIARTKKKTLKPEAPTSKFASIFASKTPELKAQSQFVPPETLGSYTFASDEDASPDELASASAWDVATRYHEFKAKASMKPIARHLRRISADAILDRARGILGSVVHPIEQHLSPWSELPARAEQVDIELEETLESSPFGVSGRAALGAQDIWMSYQEPRRQEVVLSVDTSLSMTGEKLALTAVALAVVLLQFPDDPFGIVAFENEAQVLKRLDERISIQELVERFLDVPAQGYTHLEDGLKGALSLVRSSRMPGVRPPSVVLLSDGKYTAGRDPAYLAPRFDHLIVLKMGKERASLELCEELAKKGHGMLREVGELEALPAVMYGVVKDLLRGRSFS